MDYIKKLEKLITEVRAKAMKFRPRQAGRNYYLGQVQAFENALTSAKTYDAWTKPRTDL